MPLIILKIILFRPCPFYLLECEKECLNNDVNNRISISKRVVACWAWTIHKHKGRLHTKDTHTLPWPSTSLAQRLNASLPPCANASIDTNLVPSKPNSIYFSTTQFYIFLHIDLG